MQADTDQRKAKAAAILGVEAETIGSISFQLSRMRQLGALVDVDVRGMSMFSVAATWAEWGIGDQDVRHGRLKGGVKVLIPDLYVKRLRSIEARLRQVTDRYSADITGFRPYRWIPFTAYQQWRTEFSRLEKEWGGVKAEIIQRYDEFVDQLKGDFAAIGVRAWNSIKGQGFDRIQIKGRVFTTQKQFVDFVVDQARYKMPSKSHILENLRVGYTTALLTDTADIDQRLAQQEKTQARRVIYEVKRLANEEATRIKLDAMRQAELENARKRIEEVGSPLVEAMEALRSRVLSQVETMLTSVKKNGFVRGKIATQAAGLLEFYDLMAVTNDQRLRDKLTNLRSEIGPIGKERDAEKDSRSVERITSLLEQTLALADEEIKRAQIDNRFSNLEV